MTDEQEPAGMATEGVAMVGTHQSEPNAGTYRTEVALNDSLETLHADLERLGVIPGWHRPGRAPMWEVPHSEFSPMQRSFTASRAALTRAGELVDTALAERRNLILANVESGSWYATTKTQILAYQMMLPGERARTHRHSPHAGRLILEGDGGVYTVVDGTRIFLEPGDVVLTPGGSWHGHGHDGDRPAYWLDFLDVPLVQLVEPMFFEPYPGNWAEPVRDDQESELRFPWNQTRRRLDEALKASVGGVLGVRIELGSPALPTMGLSMHQLVAGPWTPRFRTTANYQFCVVEGTGCSRVGAEEFAWERGDVVIAPCWVDQQHRSEDGAVLFAVSDEPLQRYCGYLQAERLDGEVCGVQP